MRFVKVHGAGNDFVLLPDLEGKLELDADLTRALCDRNTGLGADGVIRLAPGAPTGADVFMDYRNADGSLSEMCGNGVRCVAKWVADRGLAGDAVKVDTRAGLKTVAVVARHPDGTAALLRADMGAPVPGKVATTLEADGASVEVTTLSMGNPHAVVVVDDVATAPVSRLGPALERHPAFPERTNVEFIAVVDPQRLHGRIWERGVGETQASGTGASAMAVAAHLLGQTGRTVTVTLPGGELEVDWAEDSLYVTGAAVEVAEGELTEAWLTSVR
jgi:diaminopimelate epimerase